VLCGCEDQAPESRSLALVGEERPLDVPGTPFVKALIGGNWPLGVTLLAWGEEAPSHGRRGMVVVIVLVLDPGRRDIQNAPTVPAAGGGRTLEL
jgi:hypothetical protein